LGRNLARSPVYKILLPPGAIQRTRAAGYALIVSGWSATLFSFLLTCHFLMQNGCGTLLAL
jgi:hypothetical protein